MNKYERSKIAREARESVKNKPKVCVNCGSEDNIHIHHIVPVREGGGNNAGNLVMLCRECHIKAHANVGNRPLSGGGIEYQQRTVFEEIAELRDGAKRFKISYPYLFKGFKEYVDMLFSNDPSVLTGDDIANMEMLMMYRELGMSPKQFEKMMIEAVGEEKG